MHCFCCQSSTLHWNLSRKGRRSFSMLGSYSKSSGLMSKTRSSYFQQLTTSLSSTILSLEVDSTVATSAAYPIVRNDLIRTKKQLLDFTKISSLQLYSAIGDWTCLSNNKSGHFVLKAAKNADRLLRQLVQLLSNSSTTEQKPVPVDVVNSVLDLWRLCRSEIGAQGAESLLKFLKGQNNSTTVDLNSKSYTLVIDAWAKSGTQDAANHADALLSSILYQAKNEADSIGTERSNKSNCIQTRVLPDTFCFNATIHSLAKSVQLLSMRQGRLAAIRAQELLYLMESLYDDGHEDVAPTSATYNAVMDAWAKCQVKGSAKLAEGVLHHMQNRYKELGKVRPDVISYTTVIDAWSRSDDATATSKAISLLQEMQQQHQDGNKDVQPTATTYGAVIHALSKSTEAGMAQRAEDLLYSMVMDSNGVKPNTVCFNSVMDAWARSGVLDCGRRAEAILRRMEKLHEDGDWNVKPTTVSYTTVISAWSRSDEKGAAFKAHELLNQMLSLGNVAIKPNTVSYTAVINAWSRSKEPNAPFQAENLLKRMKYLYSYHSDRDVEPNTTTYNSVIHAWAKSEHKDSIWRAEAVLQDMMDLYYKTGNKAIRPDCVTFGTVIHAWARSGERTAHQNAEALLYRMEKEGISPDVACYTSVIHAWAKSREKGAAKRAESLLQRMMEAYDEGKSTSRPNAVMFSAVIDAWARSGEKGAELKAKALLDRMVDLYRAGDNDVKPDTIAINSVISAYSRSGQPDAPIRVLDILSKTLSSINVQPDTSMYNGVIRCLSTSRMKGSGKQAESLLMRMCNAQNYNQAKPDTFTFSSVLDALAKDTEPCNISRVEAVLRLMEVSQVEPDTVVYNTALNAMCRCKDARKAHKARELLSRMEKLYLSGDERVKPDVRSYTAVILACAHTKNGEKEEKQAAFHIAMEMMDMVRSTEEGANQYTYKAYFKAISNLITEPMLRTRLIHECFQLCCRDGQVDDTISKLVNQLAPLV